mgnify:CR=1 FL=1
MVSTNSILESLTFASRTTGSINDFLEKANLILNDEAITEAQYDKVTSHLRLDILNIELFVERNDCKTVSNPRAFIRDNIPSDDGLLSNEIFGITKEDRAGIYAYIDLHGYFIDPSCYKAWIRIDRNIRDCVHGIKKFKLTASGELVEDENGKTNCSLKDVDGELLLVSQFTLYANCRKGNRPSFTQAGDPKKAEELYEYIINECSKEIDVVQTGIFGAHMEVALINDGPFTVVLEDL